MKIFDIIRKFRKKNSGNFGKNSGKFRNKILELRTFSSRSSLSVANSDSLSICCWASISRAFFSSSLRGEGGSGEEGEERGRGKGGGRRAKGRREGG
jgi:hypothetical protein